MQMTLEGFDDYYGPNEGLQERATKELIEGFVGDRNLDPNAKYVCKTMINIARNFDVLNVKGRDTSRVMAQLLAWYQELKNEFQSTQELDPALASLLQEAQA